MVTKINGKPIRVEEKEDKDGIDWVYVGITVCGYSMIFYVLDFAASIFLGVHPFPFIHFVGGILSWLGLV